MKIEQLVEARNQITHDMRAMNEAAEAEERAFTPEERDKWDAMEADVASLDARVDQAKRASALKEIDVPTVDLPGMAPEPAQQQRAIERGEREDLSYDKVFDGWLRHGMEGITPEQRSVMMEKRAQSVGTPSAGGYTVPTDLYNQVIETMKQYGGIINVATVLNTGSGNPIDFATNDDTANAGDILAENTQVSETDTVFGTKQLGAYKFTSDMIRVSLELLQDNDVNISGYLVNILAKRLGRGEANYFAVGDGSGQPEGIVTGATISVTAAANTGIAYADLLDLEHSVDPAYRANGVGTFVFNDSTLKSIKGLMDLDGRPLWLPAISGSSPATILGHRYQVDQGMNSIGSGTVSAVFGDMSAFHIRRAAGIDIMRLQERYMDFYQHAFVGFSRVDSALLDTGAVGKLTHPA